MQKMIGFVAAAALSAAMPQFALAQSSSHDQQAAQSQQPAKSQQSAKSQSLRQEVKNNLTEAGFTNIRVMPESFLVRATDKDGNPVMMVINPDSVTEITGMTSGQGTSGQGNTAFQQQKSQAFSKSGNGNAGEPTQDTAANVPGRQNGMAAELKQDESQGLNLSTAQRNEIWKQLGSKRAEQAPSGFTPQLGETTPSSVQLQAIPGKVSRQVPAVKSYRYATLPNQVLLIDPTSKKIVAIITG